MYANFLLGSLVVSEGAAARLGRTPLDLLARHAVNDHGLLTKDERLANMKSMRQMGPIISRYPVDPTDVEAGFVIVETNTSWSETWVKLESEL